MKDLLKIPAGQPGRKQTVTASAWIERDSRKSPFQSMVSLGKGRVYKLSTATMDRNKALDFNRAHLLRLLIHGPNVAQPKPTAEQLNLH